MIIVRVHRVQLDPLDWMHIDPGCTVCSFGERPGDYRIEWPHGLVTYCSEAMFTKHFRQHATFVADNETQAYYVTDLIPLFWERYSTPEGRARVAQEKAERRERLQRQWLRLQELKDNPVREVAPGVLARVVVPGLVKEPVGIQPLSASLSILPIFKYTSE